MISNDTKSVDPSSSSSSPVFSQVAGAIEVRSVHYTREAVGRGVFALVDIPRAAIVERAHAILIPKDEYQNHLRHTVLEHYVYTARGSGGMLLALGIGSLFNHARSPNLDRRIDEDRLTIEYRACRDIQAGEELCIFYGEHVPWEAEERARRQQELKKEQEREAIAGGIGFEDGLFQ